jgi:hypothetical protein
VDEHWEYLQMNRRKFIRLAGSGLLVAATPTIFLAPRGGWPLRRYGKYWVEDALGNAHLIAAVDVAYPYDHVSYVAYHKDGDLLSVAEFPDLKFDLPAARNWYDLSRSV